ncbi:MAG: hypothetical protein WC802_01515 [Patescibacteria group bacterium]|jgi:hypothetical protein
MTIQQIGARMRELEQQAVVLRRDYLHPLRKRTVRATERERLRKVWEDAARTLKDKLPKDPVAWQRKIRKEWDAR